MINIISSNEKLIDELNLVVKLFFCEEEINDLDYEICIDQDVKGDSISTHATCNYNDCKVNREDKIVDRNFPDRYLKRYAKLAVFDILQSIKPDKILPWGSLTGIRPTKLYYELIKECSGDYMKAMNMLIDTFKVTPAKAQLVKEIIKNQKNIIKNDNLVDLYINIPFCPSKCYYCSFISAPIDKCRDQVEPYLEALIKEISATKELISTKNYIVKSIYIGGGTPTILDANQMDRLLSAIDYNVAEFTVECGRPDTITADKLDVLKKHNVTRISINPQTFCNKTLKTIGRNHTSQDILDAYKLALNYNFSINMDLIAGLGGESLLTFKKSLNKAIECYPDNITVHTLSIKRGSELKTEGGETSTEDVVSKMIEYSYPTLINAGYKPYYMYKQKNMLGNLENIGYFRDKVSIFNIDSMEEFASIIACGANAISKRYYSLNNKIERFANLKNISEYITRIDEMIDKKKALFS
ncbi:MAG: coproporphyrinogen dehydrogenase HemZ [Clostridiales bacterium]|nr:coproporphyrinogen dehydrogenase HemZ [Clostridiales bacterium]